MKFDNGLEIGASDAKASFILNNYSIFTKGTLIEPNYILYNDLKEKTQNLNNITLNNFAVSSYSGKEILYHIGRASFLKNSNSFINLMSKSPWKGSKPEHYLSMLSKQVEVVDIKLLKCQDFDFISIACNGSELEILKNIDYYPKFLRCIFHYQNREQGEYSNLIVNFLYKLNYKMINDINNETNTFHDVIFKKV